ncbi:hypothetical protein BH09PSE5_BH09PSE5_09580 [soil metagenome]
MKRWIKRSLFGLVGGAVVLGSMAGCAANRWNGDPAEMKAKVVARVGDKLDLDAAQKQKLAVLADRIQAQRLAMRGNTDPRAQVQALFAGNTLDKAGAARLVEEKTAAIRTGSPEIIAAAADFYDNLNATQQQKVREFMERGRRWGRHG